MVEFFNMFENIVKKSLTYTISRWFIHTLVNITQTIQVGQLIMFFC